ncbi:hypothetical protein GEV33_006612 [Tenebrio molitor]|uniref:Uncharacterized protein n=1 Tax=Tenebrio molitor TaxID=7067 RepID=A0A8J6HK74_TENMO|nr:hypothetical protein GEV33_006612 [Tenebrio molitor]
MEEREALRSFTSFDVPMFYVNGDLHRLDHEQRGRRGAARVKSRAPAFSQKTYNQSFVAFQFDSLAQELVASDVLGGDNNSVVLLQDECRSDINRWIGAPRPGVPSSPTAPEYQIVAVISCAILNSIHFICDSALINAFNLIVFLEGDSRYSSQLTPRNVRIEKYQNHGKEPLHLGQFPDLASSPTSHRIRLSVKMMTVNGVLLAPPLACVVGSTKEQSACLLMIGTCRDHRYVISRYI